MITVYNHTSHITHHYSLSSLGRIQEIDSLRGFAIFLVVLGHAIIVFPINIHENLFYGSLFNMLSSFHMPLMFAISGLCWSFKDYKTSFRKKFFRLVIPYLAFSSIDMLPRQMLSFLVNRPSPFIESLKKALLYGGQYWFLYVLFIIFMIYPLIFMLVSTNGFKMIIAAILLCIFAWYNFGIKLFMLESVVYYIFFFHLGVCFRYFFCEDGKLPDIKKVPVYILPAVIVLWIMLFKINTFKILTAISGIIASLLMTKYNIFNNAFSRFGKYSLQLYLLNGITLGISRAIVCNVLHIYNPTIIVAFNLFVDFFVSYAFIKYVCERSKVMRFLMGIV